MAISDAYPKLRPRNAFEEHVLLPFQEVLSGLAGRVNDLQRRVSDPAFLDQYPAKAVPYAFSRLFDVTLTAPRRNGSTGFIGNAPVVDLGAYVTPRFSNLLTGRDGTFYLCSTSISGYMSLTYNSTPGFATYSYANATPVSDIWNHAIEDNGGALQCNWFFGHQDYEDKPNIAFDVELYDKRRGRRLHESRLPPHVLTAQNAANRSSSRAIEFPPDTEIEPRVRLLEVRPGSLLDTDTAYDASQFKAYLNVVFKGFKVLAV